MSDIAVRDSQFPTQEKWQNIMAISEELSKSKALPAFIQNPAQLTMVLLAGKEAGLGVIESLNSFYLIGGKVVMYGSAVMAQLRRAGYKVRWGKCDEKEVSLTLISPEGDEHEERYTMADAIKTGNTTKEVWKKYPVNLLRFKCLGNGVRFFAPHVIHGSYLREEMDGNAVPLESELTTIEAEVVTNETVTE